MQIFKDNANRDWSLSLTIGTAMKVKDTLGVDLYELLLAQVIAALLESQFELHKVDAEHIYQSFDGPTFARAHEAFYKELIDFFQKRGRQDRATAVRKQMKMIESGIVAASTKIDGIDVDEVIERAMNQVKFGETSGE